MLPPLHKLAAAFKRPAAVLIFIKERYVSMSKTDLIVQNPLQLLVGQSEELLAAGQFGAVLARAGIGKTALVVQIALHSMLHERNVLHISLDQPVNKTSLWYREVFGLIAAQHSVTRADQLWEALLPHRFIMTFRAEGFSAPKLEERLTDLIEQNIFKPSLMVIDGLTFDEPVRESLAQMKKLAQRHGLRAWFAIRTHRHEDPGPEGTPRQLAEVDDLIDVAIQLVPTGEEVQVRILKGVTPAPENARLVLDPTTMLIGSKAA
jgi:hypothetical protein